MKCERGSDKERSADEESTLTGKDNNLHSLNISKLYLVTTENTAKISFYQNTSSESL